MVLDIGGRLFTHPVRVETIVPYRIRVQLEASAAQQPNDEYVDMAIKSNTSLEPCCSGLTHETTAVIEPVDVSFSRYQALCSENESDNPRMETAAIRCLDDAGGYTMRVGSPTWMIPSALRLRIDTRSTKAAAALYQQLLSSHRGLSQLRGDNARWRLRKWAWEIKLASIVHVTSSGEPFPTPS